MATLQGEKESLTSKVGELEGEVKKLRRDLDEETEKATAMTEVDHTHWHVQCGTCDFLCLSCGWILVSTLTLSASLSKQTCT